jgi:hypothetical protein
LSFHPNATNIRYRGTIVAAAGTIRMLSSRNMRNSEPAGLNRDMAYAARKETTIASVTATKESTSEFKRLLVNEGLVMTSMRLSGVGVNQRMGVLESSWSVVLSDDIMIQRTGAKNTSAMAHRQV